MGAHNKNKEEKTNHLPDHFALPLFVSFCFVFLLKMKQKPDKRFFFYLFQCTEIDTSKWLRLRREGITKVREEEAPKELYKKKRKPSQLSCRKKTNKIFIIKKENKSRTFELQKKISTIKRVKKLD